ncbi:chondroitinase-B domain-containing protein [Noviherbaspirillum sp.]|uniref:chondroitinase-B domain-containing protein n=1 Tax=Noviherbaspirillum sp. TaxID=1926288 RepID=UPI002FE41952
MRFNHLSLRTRVLFLMICVLAGVLSIAACLLIKFDLPPRNQALYIEKRVANHNPVITWAGNWIAGGLKSFDRSASMPFIPPISIGAKAASDSVQPARSDTMNIVPAQTSADVIRAIASARPGDVITLAPGTYRFNGSHLAVAKPGTEKNRIVLRAEQPGSVVIEHDMTEGFLVSAPYWTFEHLIIRGICSGANGCEHAFHVVGGATYFIARNNTITDFNAHFKINGAIGLMPDHGLIDGNILTNTTIRHTASAVTPVDLVAASDWVVRRNFISDFIKTSGNKVSFGAFAKGGGTGNRFEQNIVICENRLKGADGHRVGLSLGGGGTGARFCRDQRCITEQEGGVIEANLIASCSDEGIYLNRSAGSKVRHNTVVNTAGITVRFPESGADVEGNVVDSSIRSRDDGILRDIDNLDDAPLNTYFGLNSVRDVYHGDGTFAWRDQPPRRGVLPYSPLDLCGSKRPNAPAYGAFERFSDCLMKSGQRDAANLSRDPELAGLDHSEKRHLP